MLYYFIRISSQSPNKSKPSSIEANPDSQKSLAVPNLSTSSLRERLANKENIRIPTNIPLNNNCASESVKDVSKVENQIAYLAQINYGGAPRGMYNHFYDGICMAGQNSPHAILSPQFVTHFPQFSQPMCFTSAPQTEADQVQYNGSPLMWYPSPLVNFDFRINPSNMMAANNLNAFTTKPFSDSLHPAHQSAAYPTVQNGLYQPSTGQGQTTFNPTQGTQCHLFKDAGDTDFFYHSSSASEANSLLYSSTDHTLHSSCSCEKEADSRWESSNHFCHVEKNSQPAKSFKNTQLGSNQYFKAESGKLLPRRL
uniref:YTH domain-containing protein n=1 Tax=Syphacia muris TaxID=451379 RepID=A0A0N5B0V1_9BILA